MRRIASIAWKNIGRNKVRSGVIGGAIAIGLFSGTFFVAATEGWVWGTLHDDIARDSAHVQIHHAGFLANEEINAHFLREEAEAKLKEAQLPAQTATAFRLRLGGMLASPHAALGVVAKAVFEEEEKKVSSLWKDIPETQGVFLTDTTPNALVISQRMADKLKAKLKSKLVFTFQDTQGEMQSLAFRVGGIYKTSNAMLDELYVFMRYADVFDATGLPPGAVHEAALLLPAVEASSAVASQLKGIFPDMSVQDWLERNPLLGMMFASTQFMSLTIIGIFLLALSFGILNTMLMAVLERTKELGMLGAIGMSKGKIFSMVMLETVFLTLLGGVVGIVLAVAALLPTLKTGIDLSFFIEDHFEDFGFGSTLYPILRVEMLIEIVLMVLLAGVLSALYPALKALKLKPLEAIRKD